MANLQIAALKQGSIYIPFTDRLRDGKTPFNYVRLRSRLAAVVCGVRKLIVEPYSLYKITLVATKTSSKLSYLVSSPFLSTLTLRCAEHPSLTTPLLP